MTYCFDIDGTICTDILEEDPMRAIPNQDAIDEINRLFNSGNEIIIFTCRAHYGKFQEITKRQLRLWKVKYHQLIYGHKPKYDILIDSKSMSSTTWRKQLQTQKKSIGLVASSFDLLHAGHCVMLQDAKRKCDHLIAALQSDPTIDRPEKNKPVQTVEERKIQLQAIRYVDEVKQYNTEDDLEILLRKIMPDIRILGSDYKDKEYTGKDLYIDVYYHERNHGWSTSELRERVKNVS